MKFKYLILFTTCLLAQMVSYGQVKLKPKEPTKSMGNKGVAGEGPDGRGSGPGSRGMHDTISIHGLKIFKITADELRYKTRRNFEPITFYEWKDSIIDTTNYGYWFPLSQGIVLKNISENWARSVHNQFYNGMLKVQGLYFFLTNLHTDSTKNILYDLAILKANSQFEAVKQVGTNSKNQDIKNEQIIKNLKLWNEENHFKITAIDKNRIEITLWAQPGNIEKFVNQLFEVWPEVVDSSYGLKQQMVDYLKSHKNFILKFE
ncbi:MAG: DUF4253 domain-containing protein [Bacteroidia bacterium]